MVFFRSKVLTTAFLAFSRLSVSLVPPPLVKPPASSSDGINVQTVVQLGSSKIIVGDPKDLDTKILNALKAACTNGMCSTNPSDAQKIDNVEWIDSQGHKTFGTITVQIQQADLFSQG